MFPNANVNTVLIHNKEKAMLFTMLTKVKFLLLIIMSATLICSFLIYQIGNKYKRSKGILEISKALQKTKEENSNILQKTKAQNSNGLEKWRVKASSVLQKLKKENSKAPKIIKVKNSKVLQQSNTSSNETFVTKDIMGGNRGTNPVDCHVMESLLSYSTYKVNARY